MGIDNRHKSQYHILNFEHGIEQKEQEIEDQNNQIKKYKNSTTNRRAEF